MRNATTIMLPIERAEQLRNLATNLDLTIAETIGRMIRREIAEGNIDESIPGIRVDRVGDEVALTLHGDSDAVPHLMEKEHAADLAEAFDALVAGKGKGFLHVEAMVRIDRVGSGIKLSAAGQEKVLSRDVARDVADLLRKASAQTL